MHSGNFVVNLTDGYDDATTIVGIPLTAIFGPNIRREVDDFVTYDLHYNFSLANLTGEESESTLPVSVYNLIDEDPPRARLDLNYDPYTHNPFGRMIKVGLRHKF